MVYSLVSTTLLPTTPEGVTGPISLVWPHPQSADMHVHTYVPTFPQDSQDVWCRVMFILLSLYLISHPHPQIHSPLAHKLPFFCQYIQAGPSRLLGSPKNYRVQWSWRIRRQIPQGVRSCRYLSGTQRSLLLPICAGEMGAEDGYGLSIERLTRSVVLRRLWEVRR